MPPATRASSDLDLDAPALITNRELAKMQEELSKAQASRNSDAHDSNFKTSDPDKYDGKSPSQLNEFLGQIRVRFKTRPLAHPTEEAKVYYAIALLKGTAFAYVEPFLEKDDPPAWMTDFTLFANQLKKVFGDPDLVGNVTYKLRSLRQTGSATSYAAEFRRLASQLEWGNQALLSQFLEGLKESVQDEIIKTDYSQNLESLIDQAVRIDNLQYQRRQARSSRLSAQVPKKSHSPHAAPKLRNAAPMQQTSVSFPTAQPAANNSRSSPRRLSEEEREHRIKNNLCLYCGNAGHIAKQCPNRPKQQSQPARIAQFTVTNVPIQGNDQAQM